MTRLFCCLFVLGLTACDDTIPAGDGMIEQSTHSIRNGTRDPQTIALTDGEMLAIGWLHNPGYATDPYCTGTLVTGSVVLTAAHCLRDRAADKVEFSVGLLTESPKGTFTVNQMFTHPTLDLGVLYLAGDVRSAIPGIQPIQPNLTDLTKVADRLVGSPGEVAGYGDTWDPNLVGRFFAGLDITDITDKHVVVNGNGLQGLCRGDSGAPLLVPGATGAPVLVAVEERGEESCVGQDWMTRIDIASEWLSPALGDEKADSFAPAAGETDGVTSAVKQTSQAVQGCDQVPTSAPLWALFVLLGLRRKRN